MFEDIEELDKITRNAVRIAWPYRYNPEIRKQLRPLIQVWRREIKPLLKKENHA